MSEHGETHKAIAFVKRVFGVTTEHAVYLCSLPNEKGLGGGERSIADRDSATLSTFVTRWDQAERGLYTCVATLTPGSRRNRESVLELPALFVDLDFKDIIEDHHQALVVARDKLRLPASIINESGHGLHLWWILREAAPVQDNIERLEALLKQLCDVLGGDMKVTHVAALMRLPGTHNTKGGQWWEVRTIVDRDISYELDDLEAWLAEQSPLLRRKIRPTPPPDNPYLAIASQMMFKPPVDVEQRLSVMQYQGEGPRAIHDTQLAVSSSLISRGQDIDQVVSMILEATRAAAGEYGARWNWRREEANIRRMCVSWRAKIEKPKHASRKPSSKAESEVVQIAQARAARGRSAEPGPAPGGGTNKKFHNIAEAVVAVLRAKDQDLLFENGLCWHYADGIWTYRADSKIWLNQQIELACRGLGLKSDNRLVNEARGYIERMPDLWEDKVAWDQHGLVPTRSGMIVPMTGELIPNKPQYFVTWRVEADFDPGINAGSGCPVWLQMLADAFADRSDEDRAATIATLQEVLGAALVDRKPRGLRKALILVGGTNSGKSQLLRVSGGLFGEAWIDQAIGAIDGPHGLVPFTRRLPWVLDEAFNQSVWHLSATVKTLITGETISVNIKHGPIYSTRYTGPIFWATNHPPQFKESTRAIIDRLVIIECRQQFSPRAPVGGAVEAIGVQLSGPGELVCLREMSGVLSWALAGLQRAMGRGYIDVNSEGQDATDEIYRDSNLVAGFVDECVDLDPLGRVSLPDFCVAFCAWFAENKGENRSLPSNDTIGRALVALHDPKIATDRKELRDNRLRYVAGIMLNTHGLGYHERGITADLFEGKTVQTTTSAGSPNKEIPVAWDAKPKVVAMRAAQGAVAKRSVTPGDTSEVSRDSSSPEEVSRRQRPDPSSKPLF